MPELSRTQVAVYGAIAVALLFVGARAVRGEGGEGGDAGYTSSYGDYSSESGGEGETESEEGDEEGEGTFSVTGSGSDVVVDVTGAVRRPGVYRLPAGSRVDDAVKRAGGADGRAALDSINLAALLADGQQVVVPEEVTGAAAGAAAGGAGGAGGGAATGEVGEAAAGAAGVPDVPISLATATAAELDTIDGIGPITAEDIIDFREEHGGLASVDQLDQISGIGPATMEALRERLQP
jgi:competence protein ComEA